MRAHRSEHRLVDTGLLDALFAEASRRGTLHASDEVVLCGFGAAVRVALDEGLSAATAPSHVAAALARITLHGDDGPGGSGVVALGSLPFDPGTPATLHVPDVLCTWVPGTPTLWVTEVRDVPSAEPLDLVSGIAAGASAPLEPQRVVALDDDAAHDYTDAVAECVRILGEGTVAKVVLARRITGRCDAPIDTAAITAVLHDAEPTCTLYAYPNGTGRFVGASPELVLATSDGAVVSHPLAGTVALTGPGALAGETAWLAHSAKNRIEHAVVVDEIVANLEPLCDAVAAPDAPEIVELSSVAHLGTWIDGKLRNGHGAETALRALAAVHPTPAVGGVPRTEALSIIARLERVARGPWAGVVGWVDADGASSWMLAIRGVLVDDASFAVWAGAGIVADSVPDEELAETEVKLESVLRAFVR